MIELGLFAIAHLYSKPHCVRVTYEEVMDGDKKKFRPLFGCETGCGVELMHTGQFVPDMSSASKNAVDFLCWVVEIGKQKKLETRPYLERSPDEPVLDTNHIQVIVQQNLH